MGYHAVYLLHFAVKLDRLVMICVVAWARFFVETLWGVLFGIFLEYFTLPGGFSRAMHQACYVTGPSIAWMSCMIFFCLPAGPFSGLIGEASSLPLSFLPWMSWSASDLVVALEGFPPCCCCFPGHRLVQCDRIMRWWYFNLGQGLLRS